MKLRLAQALTAAICMAQTCVHAQTLPELINAVLTSHPSVRSQQAQGESAQEAVNGAKWQFFPTPSVGFEQASPTGGNDPNYNPAADKNVTTLRLQQPLWTGGRLTAGLDKAQAGVVLSQATLESLRQDLALRVVQSYADWFGAQQKRLAFEKSLKAHRTLQAQINRRITGGVSPQSDLTLLLGRTQQTEADLSTALAQEQAALGRLGQMLGHALLPQTLAASISAPQAMAGSADELQEQAQTQSPTIIKLQAQARIAQNEVKEFKADLMPEVYFRAESQHGSYVYPNQPTQNRYFVGFSSRFGAGLSSLTQVSGAQARYEAALADIDSGRLSLGEQIQADYAQATSGQQRLQALRTSLEAADTITRAWNRQFVAGRKTWPDLMNSVREAAQLEAQVADARASQLLLTWRLAIVGRGLDTALQNGQQQWGATSTDIDSGIAGYVQSLQVTDTAPALYPQSADEAITLRMAPAIDPMHLGTAMGLSGTTDINKDSEVTW